MGWYRDQQLEKDTPSRESYVCHDYIHMHIRSLVDILLPLQFEDRGR
jgi:hypothetical protein